MVERRIKIVLVVALLLVAAWWMPGPAPAVAQAGDTLTAGNEAEPQRTISVSGTGQASAQPDMAVISLGVTSEAEEASEALTENSTQMTAVIDALKTGGVLAKDIRTQTIRLSPRYEQPPRTPGGEQKPAVLVGFVANNVVEARVRDLDTLGTLLDAAVKAGGNQIQGIRFEIEDPSELLVQARDAAWEDALAKAMQLADLADAELGRALTIQEFSRTPRPYEGARAITFDTQVAAVPIEPGEQSMQIEVQVTWEMVEPATDVQTGTSR
jgi:uncharacterized protein YggE